MKKYINNKRYLIIILILIMLFVPSIIFNYIFNKSKETFTINIDDTLTQTSGHTTDSTDLSIKLSQPSIIDGIAGAEGKIGEKGDTGDDGGTYIQRGQLQNVMYNNFSTDRRYGIGTSAYAYLAQPTQRSTQEWTLTSNNQLQNTFGSCLVADNKLYDVYIDTCSLQPVINSQWTYDNTNRLVWQGDGTNSKCLDVKLVDKLSGTPVIQNNKPTKILTQENVYQVVLNNCDSTNMPINQQWTFTT